MEPTHMFYKELPIDENNIFTANISEIKGGAKYTV